jgi:excisionase family DNA binding protein
MAKARKTTTEMTTAAAGRRRPGAASAKASVQLTPEIPSKAATAFAGRLLGGLGTRYTIVDAETGEKTKIDASVKALIERLLADIAAGHAVSIVPHAQELSTFEAAAILNVSRPHVIKLIEKGELPHHMAGTHRRILLKDVLAYKAKMKGDTREALSELTRLSQEYGLY